MPITEAEISEFTEFLRTAMQEGRNSKSISEFAAEWELQRERTETLNDIQQGEVDIQAGRGKPAAQAFEDVRKKLGLAK